jgi:signal transduction histidine kinase
VGVELAQLAAGLPLAASLAMASGIGVFREGRRRASLNEAMHELRRPLQVLALSLPEDSPAAGSVESSLRMATAAIDRLDREINGTPDLEGASTPTRLRPLVEAAVERWQAYAAREGRSLTLCWTASDPLLQGNEVELAQALDNLISNGLVHGCGEVRVEVRADPDRLLLLVLNSRPSGARGGQRRLDPWKALGGRNRHGHGLRVVRRVAAHHGGSFRLRHRSTGSEARLELPLRGAVR